MIIDTPNALPQGWVECTLGDVVLPVSKITNVNDQNQLIQYVDIGSIDNVKNSISAVQTFPFIDAPSRARQIIKAGDVLFSLVRPYLRKIAYVPLYLDNEIASTGFRAYPRNDFYSKM